MSNDPTSTGQSYLDQAKGVAQSAIGAITGNPADKVCFPLDNTLATFIY